MKRLKCGDCDEVIPAKRVAAFAPDIPEYCVSCAPRHTRRVREHQVAYAMAVPSEGDGEANGLIARD